MLVFFLINKSSSCFINTSTKNLLSVSLCDILVFNFHFGVKAALGYIFFFVVDILVWCKHPAKRKQDELTNIRK